MRPLRVVLNVVAVVITPACMAGVLVFAILDRLTKSNDRRAVTIADEVAIWLYDHSPRSIP